MAVKTQIPFFKLLFWFCLCLLIPGLLIRIPAGGAGILATDLIIPLYAASWILKKTLIDRNIPKASFILPGLIFSAFAFITFWFGAWDLLLKEKLLSFAYIVRFVSILILGWSIQDVFPTKIEREWLMRGIFGITGIIIVLGFIQFWIVPDIGQWSETGKWDPHTGRLLGTWMDPNFMSGFMGLMIPVTAGAFYQSKNRTEKLLLAILTALFAIGLFLTFSRSGYLAAVAGIGLFFFLRDPRVILIGIIAGMIGLSTNQRAQERVGELMGTFATIILQDTDEIDPTANLRIQSWQRSFTLFEKYPFTGIGYNTYRYIASEEGIVDPNFYSSGGSDSTLLNILITTGIFGFILFCWFYGTLLVGSFVRYWQTKNSLQLGLAAGLCSMLVHSMFTNSILFPFIFVVIMSIAGRLEQD